MASPANQPLSDYAYSQGVSDYYIPGGEQWISKLADPMYMGSWRHDLYDAEESVWERIVGQGDKYQTLAKDIGLVDFK